MCCVSRFRVVRSPHIPYLKGMQLQHRLKRDEQHQLFVCIALHPVVCAWFLANERARLRWLEEHPQSFPSRVDVEELTSLELDLAGDVCIAARNFCTQPVFAAAARGVSASACF